MHLEPRHEEAGEGREAGAEDDAQQKSQDRSCSVRNARGVKDVSEDRTGVDALVHHDGRGDHRHTDHTADGEVSTGQEDQTRNAECKEHTGRCLLQDVQDVGDREQLRVLHNRGDDAQEDEDRDDDDVESLANHPDQTF